MRTEYAEVMTFIDLLKVLVTRVIYCARIVSLLAKEVGCGSEWGGKNLLRWSLSLFCATCMGCDAVCLIAASSDCTLLWLCHFRTCV